MIRSRTRLPLLLALSTIPACAFSQDPAAATDVPAAADPAPVAAPDIAAPAAPATTDLAAAPADATAPAAPAAADAPAPDASAAAAAPDSAAASEGSGNSNAPVSHNRLVEEVIVTAQKREENLQNVPISVSAFNADALDAKGIVDAKGLAQATPGVYYGQTVNFAIIYIRGVGSDAFLPDSDPSVATYIDGIYYPFANGLSQAFGAVERVEVLKGPQGTLFGRNSTGGAFNTITKSPGPTFETSLLASYQSYNDMNLRGYVNIPIVDSLAASLSVVHQQSDNYYTGTINNVAAPGGVGGGTTARGLPNTQENAARLKLKWNVLDNVDVNLAGFFDLTQGLSSSAMPNVAPSALQQSLDTAYGVTTQSPGHYKVNVDTPGYFSSDNHVFYGQVNWHPDWLDVKLLGSHQLIKTDNDFDFDGTTVPFIQFNAPGQFANVTTAELQLISNKGGLSPDWLDAIAGLYYFKERSGFPDNHFTILGGVSNGQLLGVPLPTNITNFLIQEQEALGLPGLPNGTDLSLHDQLGTKSYAAYTQETAHIFNWLDLTAGARYQTERRTVIESDVYDINDDGSETKISYVPPFPTERPSEKSHNISPKFVVDVKPIEDLLLYTSYTKGYKSGTYKTVNVYTQPSYVEPETVQTIEAGVKSTFLDGAVRFNAAAFQNTLHNLQVQFISVLGGGVAQLENAPGARVRGAEFDTQVTPLVQADPGLVVNLAMTYLNSKFTSFPSGSGYDETTGVFFGELPGGINTGRDFTGNKVTRTPKISGTFGVNQLIENVGDGNIELAGDLYYNSGFYYLAQNSPTSKQKEYYVANASVSYFYQPWKTRVTLFGKNLNDAHYTYSKFILDTGTLEYLAPPLTVGVRLGLDF